MANFQFGQDNVGSGWQVPSWYVQGMSQSPMAASIAGIGNSIAAFSGGYQAAKQAEREYGLNQQQMGLNERKFGLQESEFDQRKKLIEQQAADARNEEARRKRLAEYQMWLLEGGRANQYSSGSIQPNVLQNSPFHQDGLTPATPSRQQAIQSQYGAPIQYNPEAPLFPQ